MYSSYLLEIRQDGVPVPAFVTQILPQIVDAGRASPIRKAVDKGTATHASAAFCGQNLGSIQRCTILLTMVSDCSIAQGLLWRCGKSPV